jgi:hypothetical protein
LYSELRSPSAAKLLSAAAGTVCGRRVRASVPTWFEKQPKKSKAASIKLTLAAVGLDACELLRSCTSSLVHNGERRDAKRAHLLEVGAPKRAADDINR